MDGVIVVGCVAAALAIGVPIAAAAQEAAGRDDPPRLRIALNENWRYAPGAIEGAEAPTFDDSRWEEVDLPHTWNTEDALDGDAGYRRGVGWYRKTLPLTAALCDRPVFILFEGANQTADVWWNGTRLGRHVGGYTGFAFEATGAARCGATNVIAVRVDNAHDPDVPPLDADFTFYGGIYRDVWLIATGTVHLDALELSDGLRFDTPGLETGHPRVRYRGSIVNSGADLARVRVVHHILEADSDTLAVFGSVSPSEVGPGGRMGIGGFSDPIPRPRLWSPEDPYLYRVVTEVYVNGEVTDRVESPLGFRWFDVDPDRGFLLNGEPRSLRGTNRHQDRAGHGSALPDSLHAEDIRIVKETGFDFLRLAHYPQDPAVLDATDSLGLLVWMEIPIVNQISMTPEFTANAERMLVEMIRQHANHPSVAFWGTMNEVRLRDPDPLLAGYGEAVRGLAERLDARARNEDPSRPTAIAVSLNEIEAGTALLDVADVLGLNLYFGWYYRDLETLGGFLDSLHAALPDRPLLVSEYGAGSDERVHASDPEPFDFSSEYIRVFHEATLPQLEARPWLVGSAVWNQFDFGSALRQDTKPSLNQKGLHFFDRRPKDVAWYYRAALLERPVIHVAADEHTVRAGSRPETREWPVKVYTNLAEIELFQDDVSLGRRTVSNRTASWPVTFRDGRNRLLARGASPPHDEVRGDDGAVEAASTVGDALVIHYEERRPFFEDSESEVARVAINAGDERSFVDDHGVVWEPDRAYAEGSWGHVGGERLGTQRRIYATDEDPLYQTARVGFAHYRFDVPDGSYEIELRLAEIDGEARPGRRVFDVVVNGETRLAGLDLAREPGPDAAAVRSASLEVTGGQGIEIRFVAQAGEPMVNGILIRRR